MVSSLKNPTQNLVRNWVASKLANVTPAEYRFVKVHAEPLYGVNT